MVAPLLHHASPSGSVPKKGKPLSPLTVILPQPLVLVELH
jgi:hypothetical protein